MFRTWRRWVLSKIFGDVDAKEDHMLYKIFSVFWESLVPFVEVAVLIIN